MPFGVIAFQGRSDSRESQVEVSLGPVVCAMGITPAVFTQA